MFVMYGKYDGKQQPIFGNKGIGCRECKFSMHGKVRSKTWTTLSTTVSTSENVIELSEDVDWQVG